MGKKNETNCLFSSYEINNEETYRYGNSYKDNQDQHGRFEGGGVRFFES